VATSSGSDDRKRILVVEDDPSVRLLIQTALRSQYEVETAENGAAALARVSRVPAPDLVICDVMMPQMGGLEFARKMRNLTAMKTVPLIFLTAKGTPTDVIQGINAGARHYLVKPFKIDDLLKKVQKTLRG
jgi:DNA-binding response OmpR family regulator